jgi:hypothetical protein
MFSIKNDIASEIAVKRDSKYYPFCVLNGKRGL